jgi:hypothetical protein
LKQLEGDGKFRVGAVDRNAVPDLEELVAFAQVIEADAGGFVGGRFCLEVVLDQDAIFLLLKDFYKERFRRGDNVVFDAILDQELEAEGGDLTGKAVRPDIDVDMQEGFEAGLEHIDIGPEDLELFVEGDGLAGIFSEELTIEVGEGEDKLFGAVVLFADHDAERAQRVEKEVRIHLLLQDFESGAEVFVLQLRVGEQDIFLFREGGQGGLDGEDDEGGEGEFDKGEEMRAVDIDVKVEDVDEPDKGEDEENIDEGLDGEAEGEGTARFFEPVGDPLVDGPQEEKEDKAGDPGADDAAGFDGGGEDVGVEEADARHEEGAEKGEEDLPAGGFIFGREVGQSRFG